MGKLAENDEYMVWVYQVLGSYWGFSTSLDGLIEWGHWDWIFRKCVFVQ